MHSEDLITDARKRKVYCGWKVFVIKVTCIRSDDAFRMRFAVGRQRGSFFC